jgi:hypothetical protein
VIPAFILFWMCGFFIEGCGAHLAP